MEAAHNNIYGFGEGITSGQRVTSTTTTCTASSPISRSDRKSYQHTNALIDSGGSGIRVVHNTFLNWMPPRAGGLAR